jgi:hypothetical protein
LVAVAQNPIKTDQGVTGFDTNILVLFEQPVHPNASSRVDAAAEEDDTFFRTPHGREGVDSQKAR